MALKPLVPMATPTIIDSRNLILFVSAAPRPPPAQRRLHTRTVLGWGFCGAVLSFSLTPFSFVSRISAGTENDSAE